MNQNRFVAVTRSLGGIPTRRAVLRGLAGAGLGLGVAPRPDVAARKKRKRKVRVNAFGCADVGGFCKTAGQCCSGVCEGKPGKKTCRAHDTGGCRPAGQSHSCDESGTNIPCTTSAGHPDAVCELTTGNAGFCAYSGGCYPCTKDAECQALYGAQAACVRCAMCTQTGGASCAYA